MVVTNLLNTTMKIASAIFIGLIMLQSLALNAAVLEADKADVLYHSYEGGGMKIDGPALLLRKKITESVAVSAYYYVDTISSASVDVLSNASPYSEERQEGSLGLEYLHDKTILSVAVSKSDEDDYLAQSLSFNISHDLFGDLTNVNFGISYGDNDVMRNGDENFLEKSKQYRVRSGISQILTRNLTASLNIEGVTDEGYLNNPYRTVRYLDQSVEAGFGSQTEVYPNTRNSFAIKLSSSYYLPYRAALFGHYRYFSDSWDIEAHDIELTYRHPLGDSFVFEVKYRQYQQTQANFYSDLFSHRNAQNFLARDKELSDFDDVTLGLGVTYHIPKKYILKNMSSEVSLQWDRISFDYHNFRDRTVDAPLGEEPLYSFDADVIRAFISVYF
ncbi:MAG: DUF3570 domain-containing protein [Thalassotalea sp.]